MIIYLDQNKWIEVSRMVHGKDDSPRAKRIVTRDKFKTHARIEANLDRAFQQAKPA